MSRQLDPNCCPRVSLIVPNLNGKNLLRECLSSLSRLNYPNYEIIVSDGGSTDGSSEMVNNEFPNVLFIEEKGAGIGRSVNLGVAKATGDIIGFDLNSDEIFESNWLTKLVNILLSSEKIGVVGGTRIFYGTKDLVDEGGYRIDFLGIYWSNIKVDRKNLPKNPQEVSFVGTPLLKKSLFNSIGGCDEQYYLYFEDSDFCLRVKKAGFKVLWVPDAVSYHKRSSTINANSITFLSMKNNIRFHLIHFRLLHLPFALLFQVIIFPLLRISYTLLTFLYVSDKSTSSSNNRRAFLRTSNLGKYIFFQMRALLWNIKNINHTVSRRRRVSEISQRLKLKSMRELYSKG